MDYMTLKDAAEKWGVTPRRVNYYCAGGRKMCIRDRFYNSFTVKYEGFQGLWEAVQYGLNPTAPKTLLWINQTIQKDFPYRFDVFDPQYDDLAKELERDNYMELFTCLLYTSRCV